MKHLELLALIVGTQAGHVDSSPEAQMLLDMKLIEGEPCGAVVVVHRVTPAGFAELRKHGFIKDGEPVIDEEIPLSQ